MKSIAPVLAVVSIVSIRSNPALAQAVEAKAVHMSNEHEKLIRYQPDPRMVGAVSFSLYHGQLESEDRDAPWADAKERNIRNYLLQRAGSKEFQKVDHPIGILVNHVECRLTLCELQLTGYVGNARVWNSLGGRILSEPWGSDLSNMTYAIRGNEDKETVAVVIVLFRRT